MKPELRAMWEKAGYSKMGSSEVAAPPPQEFISVYHITSPEYGLSDIVFGRMKVARFMDLNDPFELLALNIRDKPTGKRLEEFRQTYNSDSGLLCFSSNWTNPVLWSHYGSRHRGICLGFDLERGRAEQVDYKDERILAHFDNDSAQKIAPELKKLLQRTKFIHWRYEEELRVLVPLNDKHLRSEGNLHFYPFGRDLMCGD